MTGTTPSALSSNPPCPGTDFPEILGTVAALQRRFEQVAALRHQARHQGGGDMEAGRRTVGGQGEQQPGDGGKRQSAEEARPGLVRTQPRRKPAPPIARPVRNAPMSVSATTQKIQATAHAPSRYMSNRAIAPQAAPPI